MRTVTMTFEEYFSNVDTTTQNNAVNRVTTRFIKRLRNKGFNINSLEDAIASLKRNKTAYTAVALGIGIGLLLTSNSVSAQQVTRLAGTTFSQDASAVASATGSASSSIDPLGAMFLDILRKVGYWACIIMCMIEIVRSIMDGDTRDIGRAAIKYIVAFMLLYLLPMTFDIIRLAFTAGHH